MCASNRQRVFRNILGDARRRSHIRALAHAHRSHQGAVATNEYTIVNDSSVLVDAVVVAGDGAGADVHTRSNLSIAQVCEVVRLRSFAQFNLLGFDEISNMRAFADLASRTQVRIRAQY